jgi:hypothetical protein
MIAKILLILIPFIRLGAHIAKHGEKKEPEKYNGWTHIAAMLFWFALLYYAGLFDSFKL